MSRRPIRPSVNAGGGDTSGPAPEEHPVERDEFREALSFWASGVTIVAVRDDDGVQAMTVSSLTSVSDVPPTVLVSLTSSARLVPFIRPGVTVGISVLGQDQRRLASVYANSYPVGPSPFPDSGPPLVEGALVGLTCVAQDVLPVGGSYVVACRVVETRIGPDRGPLLYFRRGYERLG